MPNTWKQRTVWLGCLCVVALGVRAAGGEASIVGETAADTIAAADKLVAVAQRRAEQDPFRPAFHFRAPAQWMNDICAAIHWQGWYHVFYQFNPVSDTATWRREPTCWGHARSRDLVTWEHLPIALAPAKADGDWACHSGSATLQPKSGRPMLFYTYNPFARPAREQWAAVPLGDDLIRWKKVDVGLALGKSGIPADLKPGWADPFVFKAGDRTFATFKSSGGMVCEALNSELTRWRFVTRLPAVQGECPNFFKLQDRWVLLKSTYPMSYQVGDFDAQAVSFATNGPAGILDYAYGMEKPVDYKISRGFYGSNVMFDDRGRCILVAWSGAFKPRGWNGCMSLPRILTLGPDGRPRQAPAPELARLRGPVTTGKGSLENAGMGLGAATGDMLEAEIEIVPGTAQSFGLELQSAATPGAPISIASNGRELNVAGTVVPLATAPGQSLKLHAFFDKSLLEVFIDDGLATVTRVCYPPAHDLKFTVFARGGTADVRAAQGWVLKPIWGAGQ